MTAPLVPAAAYSEAVDLLFEARRHINGLQGLLLYAQNAAKEGKLFHAGETVCEVMADAQAFMDAGIFGDRKVSK